MHAESDSPLAPSLPLTFHPGVLEYSAGRAGLLRRAWRHEERVAPLLYAGSRILRVRLLNLRVTSAAEASLPDIFESQESFLIRVCFKLG